MAFETEFVHSIVAGGTADALTVTYTNVPSSLTDGMEIHVRAAAANATTMPTLNVNSLGAKTITKFGGAALVAGDIVGNLHECTFRYNLANTRWELMNPASVASLSVGTSANDLVQLNGSAKLPAVDGSQLTNMAANPTATIVGGSAINGSATTFMRSDAAPALALTKLTNSLAADVTLNSISTYFDGPSVAQGTSGVWFVSGGVTVTGNTDAGQFYVKLWDGTTVIDSKVGAIPAATGFTSVSVSGYITNPAANIKISVKDVSDTSGKILFNQSGNGKDSTLTAIRIG